MATKKRTMQPLHPEMPPIDAELASHAALGEALRRCSGSTRFGIEPHDAPIAAFPKQPSRKDGLGTMCIEHWRAYVTGLREARVGEDGRRGQARQRTGGRRRVAP